MQCPRVPFSGIDDLVPHSTTKLMKKMIQALQSSNEDTRLPYITITINNMVLARHENNN
jgi:hypothetical protein